MADCSSKMVAEFCSLILHKLCILKSFFFCWGVKDMDFRVENRHHVFEENLISLGGVQRRVFFCRFVFNLYLSFFLLLRSLC